MAVNDSLYFHRYIIESVLHFQQCLNTSSVYECVNQVRTNYDKLRIWIGSSVYYIHIQKWLQFWPRENFLFVKTEEMSSNPSAALRNVTDFLSLLPFSDLEEEVSLINDRQNVQQKYYRMLPRTERLLKSFYEPFSKKTRGFIWSEILEENHSTVYIIPLILSAKSQEGVTSLARRDHCHVAFKMVRELKALVICMACR